MTGEGSDRGGVKAPRTLFSLGRPGAKQPRDDGEGAPTSEASTTVDQYDDSELQYACGACGALLPTGAAFCGECGTPVALDDVPAADGVLDELSAEGAGDAATIPPGAGLMQPEVALDLGDDGQTVPGQEGTAPTTEASNGAGGDALIAGAAGAAVLDSQVPTVDANGSVPASNIVPGQEPSAAAAGFDPSTTSEIHAPTDAGPPPPPMPPQAEPAAVLYADPNLAEPLPQPAESWGSQAPVVGNARDGLPETDSPATDEHGVPPAAAAAAGAGVVGAAVLGAEAVHASTIGASAGAPAAAPPGAVPPPPGAMPVPGPPPPPGAEGATTWTVAPEPGAGVSPPPPGVGGTTAQSMPYGTGPLETSGGGGRGVLIAVVVVVGLLLFGAIAFALTRGNGSDVATQPTLTTVAPAKKASSTTAGTSATTASTTATSLETTTTLPTDTTADPSLTTVTTTQQTIATTQQTAPQTNPTTQQTAPQTTAVNPTQAPAAVSFQGPGSFRLAKGGSSSFTVSNTGGGPGTFQCNSSGVSINPPNGSLNPGASQQIVVQDYRRVGAQYTLTCVGAGGGQYGASVFVD